jgi:hypothetical protein
MLSRLSQCFVVIIEIEINRPKDIQYSPLLVRANVLGQRFLHCRLLRFVMAQSLGVIQQVGVYVYIGARNASPPTPVYT